MAEPREVRYFSKTGRSMVVLSWWHDGEDNDTHWLCALMSEHPEARTHQEMRVEGHNAAEGWNYVTIRNSILERKSTLVDLISEADRKSICEIIFDPISKEDTLSDRTKKLIGPVIMEDPDGSILQYMKNEEIERVKIELEDPFWQDFYGVVPIRKYRKHAKKKVRRKPHIKHRRWEDDDWDGGLGD